MSRRQKLLNKAHHGARLSFAEAMLLAQWFGFVLVRISGSHHIFRHEALDELLNLQDRSGEAKDYQVRQLLALIETYGLTMEGVEQVGGGETDQDNRTENEGQDER